LVYLAIDLFAAVTGLQSPNVVCAFRFSGKQHAIVTLGRSQGGLQARRTRVER
jgi:hypothetical protein